MWTRRATAAMVMAVFLYLAATYGELGWFYLLDALAVALVVVSLALPYLSLRGIEAQRRLPTSAHEGEAVTIETILKNPGHWGRHLIEVESSFPPEGDLHRLLALALPAKGELTLSYRPRCRRRGEYDLPPLRLRCGAPFGLFMLSRHLPAPAQITVYPQVIPLAAYAVGAGDTAEGRLRPRPGPESEFLWTREYRPGDPRRLIHWRSSARRHQLLVKERPRQEEGSLFLLIDTGQGVDEGPWGESNLDLAVRAAASLAVAALERGQGVELSAIRGEEVGHLVPRSPHEALTWLARLEATGRLPFAALVAQAAPRLGTTTATIAILPSPSHRHVAVLAPLTQNGLRLLLVEPWSPGEASAEFQATFRELEARWPTYLIRNRDLSSCLSPLLYL